MKTVNRLQQFATPYNTSAELPRLSAAQIRAAQLVAMGESDFNIAGQLKVDRSTVYRWRSRSVLFRAEVNRHLADISDQLAAKLRDVALHAIDEIERALTEPLDYAIRLKAASLVLSKVPVNFTAGPTDPRELARPAALRRDADNMGNATSPIFTSDGTRPITDLIGEVIADAERDATTPDYERAKAFQLEDDEIDAEINAD